MNRFLALNKLRWYARLPFKGLILAVTLLAVCFPYPNLLVRHLRHWANPNALVEPESPAIQPFVEELQPEMDRQLTPDNALRLVEHYVYMKIPYAWDWETWGTADYLPTVAEVVEMGREDCDGRAVLAASILCNFGFNAQLVTDFTHVWVKTDEGETMGPGKHKAIIVTDEGLKVQPGALWDLPKALGYAVAVFPLPRELIVLAVFWWLLLPSRGGWARALAGLGLLLGGLLLLRLGGASHRDPLAWVQAVGLGSVLAGSAGLLSCRRSRK